MQILKATILHLDDLVPMFDDYRQSYRMSSNIKAGNQFLTERLQKQDSEIYIAVADTNEIAGFIQLYPLFSSLRMRKVWILNDLYVKVAFRGEGVARKLVARAKELSVYSRSAGLLVETQKTNEVANSMYPRLGFQMYRSFNSYFWENKLASKEIEQLNI
ncbi:MAG: GNAT family N-acetyltransferase [Chitinophagales bacterium]